MKIYFTLDDKGYLNGWGSTPSYAEGEVCLEIEEGHKFFKDDSNCYKYVDGELILDEERKQKRIEERLIEENKPSDLDMLALAVMELAEIVLERGGK